jgi:glutathione S-transferase
VSTLYTFTISHFSEKARWGLEFAGVPFEEKVLLPGIHNFTTRRIAPRTSVPILKHDGAYIQGSGAILDYAEEKLGATGLAVPEGDRPKAKEWEARFDRAFGRGVQTIFYDELLKEPRMVVDLWSQRGPSWAPAFYGAVMPVLKQLVRRSYCPSPERVSRAHDEFRAAYDAADDLLRGRQYLFGDRPTRADITLAALLAPAVRPPEHLVRWPEPPAALVTFERELKDRPTWHFVERMYREHR